MFKTQHGRMQGESLPIPIRMPRQVNAIPLVPQHGMPRFGEMDANLVAPACLEPDANARRSAKLPLDAVMRTGPFPRLSVTSLEAPQTLGGCQTVAESPSRLRNRPRDNRRVFPLRR